MLTNSMYANAVECNDVLVDTRWSLAWLIMTVSCLGQPAFTLMCCCPIYQCLAVYFAGCWVLGCHSTKGVR